MFRSKFEARVAEALDLNKVKFEYEPFQLEYWIKIRSGECDECGSGEVYQTRWYTPDFVLKNGIILETKGKFTPKDRAKMVAVLKAHPKLDIRMVFMRDNKLTRNSPWRYSSWCTERGITYTIFNGDIPDEWRK